jgi:DNA-binding transcriptional LysR family regulator
MGQSLVDFAVAHPDIMLDINLDDRFVDLVEEGYDIAIRISRLESSSLIAKRLAPFAMRLCASPALIAKKGKPERPQDLANLPCIVDSNARWLSNWPFRNEKGDVVSVPVSGPVEVNSPMAVRAAALAGLGFAIMPDFIVADDLASGRLFGMLDEYLPEGGGIYAVYPHRRYLPAKIRVLVDFLAHWFKQREKS